MMKDYVHQAIQTKAPTTRELLDRLTDEENIDLIHGSLGLASEVGEFIDPIKAHIFYGKPIDRVNLKEELGDLLWYIAIICFAMGFDLEEVMRRNIEKLRLRYPNRFKDYDAQNRDLKAEREVLEEDRGIVGEVQKDQSVVFENHLMKLRQDGKFVLFKKSAAPPPGISSRPAMRASDYGKESKGSTWNPNFEAARSKLADQPMVDEPPASLSVDFRHTTEAEGRASKVTEGRVSKGGHNIPEPGELERRPPAPGGSGG